MDDLAVGVIRTSHGVRGYVKVFSFSGETAHLLALERVHVRIESKEKEYRVEDTRPYNKGVLMKLEGVDTPETAKTLAGAELWVSRDCAAPLAENEYYVSDMVGCSLVSGGRTVGEIISVSDSAAGDLLEVKTGTGVIIVPFTSRFVGEVNTGEGTVELLIEELLE